MRPWPWPSRAGASGRRRRPWRRPAEPPPETAASRASVLGRRGAVRRLRGGRAAGGRRPGRPCRRPSAAAGSRSGRREKRGRRPTRSSRTSPRRRGCGQAVAASAPGALTSSIAGPTLSKTTNWRTASSLRARPAGEREAGRGDHVGGRSAPQRRVPAGSSIRASQPAAAPATPGDRGGAEDGRRRKSLRRRRLLEDHREAERPGPPAAHRLAARPAVRGVAAQTLELTGSQSEADRAGDRLFGLPALPSLACADRASNAPRNVLAGAEQQRGGGLHGHSEDDREPGGAQTLHVVQEERRALPQLEGLQRRLDAAAGLTRRTATPPCDPSRWTSAGHGGGARRRARRARNRRRGRTVRQCLQIGWAGVEDRPDGTRPRASRPSPQPRPPRRRAGAGRSRRPACGRAGSSGRSRHALRGAVPAAARPGRTRCRGHQPGAVWWMP